MYNTYRITGSYDTTVELTAPDGTKKKMYRQDFLKIFKDRFTISGEFIDKPGGGWHDAIRPAKYNTIAVVRTG
jgi:hypothetical protein